MKIKDFLCHVITLLGLMVQVLYLLAPMAKLAGAHPMRREERSVKRPVAYI